MAVSFGDFAFDPERRQLLRLGEPVPLETKAYELLGLLLSRRPNALSKAQIRSVLWPGTFVSESALARLVTQLRAACGDDAQNPRFIRTVHGFGYAFCGEAHESGDGHPAVDGEGREAVAPRCPYPGLSPFVEEDAERFFGREREVEALCQKVRRQELLAVIGPSGVGKTSLLRAGLVPGRPAGWGAVACTPGGHPFAALGQALAPLLAPDSEGVKEVFEGVSDAVRGEDPARLVSAASRWRRRHAEALLVLDQFEELFTLNPPQTQERFARLVGRLVAESGLRIVLGLRDDFFMRCGEHPDLAPVFHDVTPLLPPSAEGLKRALREPAAGQGVSFEDEALLEEMTAAVSAERGALPLLAFTASRLWEERDRERGLLTREAYERIGGMGGALAQHAEQTLERVGGEREGIVREIFRNLVTAQWTRASAEREELLSVFPDREAASQVLGALVDARLLTSYEVPAVEGATARHRIEIVHESLLEAWPRLVRWQAQDEDGAVLRDQLKQAAHLWNQKGRPDDLLWTGTSEREFEVWRERYPGKLTAVEDRFAQAMVARARRRQRIRRIAVAAAIVGLSVVAGAIAVSRHKEALARQEAQAQARRAEAGKLLALGQTRIEEAPSEALAYALASLEQTDTEGARLFAWKALSKGPPARVFRVPDGTIRLAFSPDGQWLATAGSEDVLVWARNGGPAKTLKRHDIRVPWPPSLGFTRSDGLLAVGEQLADAGLVNLWSLPEEKVVRTLEFDAPTWFTTHTPQLLTVTLRGDSATGRLEFRSWPSEGGDSRRLGFLDMKGWQDHIEDPTGTWLAVARDRVVQLLRLAALGEPPARVIPHPANVRRLVFDASSERLATADADGTIRIWNLANASSAAPRVLRRPADGLEDVEDLGFTPDGSRLRASVERSTLVWDLNAPPGAEPLEILTRWGTTFDPTGEWLASAEGVGSEVRMWPIRRRPSSFALPVGSGLTAVGFSPDGRWVASASGAMEGEGGAVRVWPLAVGTAKEGHVVLRTPPLGGFFHVGLDPSGRQLLAVPKFGGAAFLTPVEGGRTRRLEGFSKEAFLGAGAFGPAGRHVAVAAYVDPEGVLIRVWDVETGALHVLDPREGRGRPEVPNECGVTGLAFTPNGRLLSSGRCGLQRWDVETGSSELLWKPRRPDSWMILAMSADGRLVVTAESDEQALSDTDLVLHDLEKGTSRPVTSHGRRVRSMALGSAGRILVTGDKDGIVRVGRLDGSLPHLLFGHTQTIYSTALSPDGSWIATADLGDSFRLWPMPDLSKTPFHALPYEELLARLRSLTNLRAVPDAQSPGGYKIETGPFPGWADVPTW
jgi:WD40 repeat protein/DNA-binding winged helix-turn-helix (wHTH) protein